MAWIECRDAHWISVWGDIGFSNSWGNIRRAGYPLRCLAAICQFLEFKVSRTSFHRTVRHSYHHCFSSRFSKEIRDLHHELLPRRWHPGHRWNREGSVTKTASSMMFIESKEVHPCAATTDSANTRATFTNTANILNQLPGNTQSRVNCKHGMLQSRPVPTYRMTPWPEVV